MVLKKERKNEKTSHRTQAGRKHLQKANLIRTVIQNIQRTLKTQ